MPATPVYALRYPSLDDQAGHGHEQIQHLAEGTEAMLSGLLTDTGVLTGPALSMGPGWSLTQSQYRVIGETMELFLWLELTGAAISANSAGNIVGDPLFATVSDVNRRPAFTAFGTWVSTATSGHWQFEGATGQIVATDAHAGSQIATGHTVRLHAVYPLP